MLDWSAAETAALLDTSVAAANSALQRARATLREQLPEPPADRAAAADLSDDERALLQGFIDTHERGDVAAAAAMCATTSGSPCRPTRGSTRESRRSWA